MLPWFCLFLLLSSHAYGVDANPFDWLRRFSSSSSPDTSGLWGWVWAADGTVSVVDRTPPMTFPARPASFGAELSEPLLGYVIPLSAFTAPCGTNLSLEERHPNPVFGCPDLCISGPHAPDPNERWIALVQRGGCPFVDKARQAQRLGAKAVVVGGDAANPEALLNMYSERGSADVTIAATYIKYWDYLELSALISASNTSHSGLRTVSLLISTEFSAWEWPIVTFSVILLLPSLLTFVTLVIHRIRAARQAQRDRAPEDIVHSLPWRVWTGTGWQKHEATCPVPSSSNDVDIERGNADATSSCSPDPSTSPDPELPSWVDQQLECVICLELFAKGDRVRVLPCHHMFHMDEVDEWLIHKKKLCPICKADVTRPHVTADSPESSSHSVDSHEPAADNNGSSHSVAVTPVATERTPLLPINSTDPHSDR